MLPKIDPTTTASWRRLQEHFEQTKDVHMKILFAQESDRFQRFSIFFNDILVDYAKHRITEETMRLLQDLADGSATTGGH